SARTGPTWDPLCGGKASLATVVTMSVTSRFRRRTLLAGVAGTAIGAVALSSCSSPTEDGGSVEMRSVDHPLGTSDIPVSPQRIVCLDAGVSLQTALEIGAPVVAGETLAGDITIPT